MKHTYRQCASLDCVCVCVCVCVPVVLRRFFVLRHPFLVNFLGLFAVLGLTKRRRRKGKKKMKDKKKKKMLINSVLSEIPLQDRSL